MINVVLKPKKEIRVSLKPEQGIQIEATKKYLFDPAIVQEYVDASAENAELSQQIYDQFVAESDEFKEEVKVISRETAKDEVSGVVAEVEANVEIAKEASQSAAESAEKAEQNAAKVPDPYEENTALIYKDGVVQWGKAAAENDGVSITENAKGQIQTIGVIDNTGVATKVWNGTKAEYDAIENKDPDTLYNVSDDEVDHNTSIGLDIGDIGFAPLGIDETQNKRRYLNGQVILQAQFVSFTAKVKNAILLYPSLGATEENWQAEVTNSKLGQCGKFVIDDTLGTIRLPKVVNINGLQDLALMGSIKAESLPNITGNTTINIANFSTGGASGGNGAITQTYKAHYAWAGNNRFDGTQISIDASLSSSTYQNNAPVQQEAVQYPYFIQVATGVEESIDVTREIQLNNPFFLGMSQYFESEPKNVSWLISNGSFHSGATYVSFYEWLLKIYNGTEIVDGVSVKSNADIYDDYDYVIDTANNTFRLPLLNGSENIPDNNNVQTFSGFPYTADRNQVIFVNTRGETQSFLGLSINGVRVYLEEAESGVRQRINAQLFVNKGDVISTSGAVVANDYLAFAPCIGNGSLYFYVGETIQDANLISIGKVTELLARLENYDYVIKSKTATNSDPTWYRVYKSGWVEQGGAFTNSQRVTTVGLPIKMKDSNYSALTNLQYGDPSWSATVTTCIVNGSKKTDSIGVLCYYNGSFNTGLICWEVKGQGAK